MGTRPTFGIHFGANAYFKAAGNSDYNSAQITLRHTSAQLQVLVGYTYSKSMDNVSGATASGSSAQIDVLNPKAGWALSSFNTTNDFVASYAYTLPFEKMGGANRLTSGWTLTGITRFSTGLPVFLSE